MRGGATVSGVFLGGAAAPQIADGGQFHGGGPGGQPAGGAQDADEVVVAEPAESGGPPAGGQAGQDGSGGQLVGRAPGGEPGAGAAGAVPPARLEHLGSCGSGGWFGVVPAGVAVQPRGGLGQFGVQPRSRAAGVVGRRRWARVLVQPRILSQLGVDGWPGIHGRLAGEAARGWRGGWHPGSPPLVSGTRPGQRSDSIVVATTDISRASRTAGRGRRGQGSSASHGGGRSNGRRALGHHRSVAGRNYAGTVTVNPGGASA